MLDQLHEAMIRGQGPRVIADVLEELSEFYPRYFAEEEAMMAEAGVPEAEAHRQAHTRLLEELTELRRRAEAGHLAITYDTMQTMRGWIEEHVNVEDRAAATWIMEHRSSTPRESPEDSTREPGRACGTQ